MDHFDPKPKANRFQGKMDKGQFSFDFFKGSKNTVNIAFSTESQWEINSGLYVKDYSAPMGVTKTHQHPT